MHRSFITSITFKCHLYSWLTFLVRSCALESISRRSYVTIFMILSVDPFIDRYPQCKFPTDTMFFYLGFLSQPFTNHGTAGEGGGYFFNSSLPLSPTSQNLDISQAITAGSSPLHIGQPDSILLLVSKLKLLTTKLRAHLYIVCINK